MCNRCNNNGCSSCDCGYNPPLDCGCEPQPDPPEFTCPNPEPCAELVPDNCVTHPGPDIKCFDDPDPNIDDAYKNYPDVKHYVVLASDTATNRRLPAMLGNIKDQLCYLFSKDFISRFLTLIDTDVALKTQFCTMVCSCDCEVAPCDAPLQLTKTINCLAGSVTYQWGLIPGATYEYKYYFTGPSPVITVGTTSTSPVTITGLTNGTCLEFKIRSICSETSVSTWVEATTACCPIPTVCDPVTDLVAESDCNASSIVFSWTNDPTIDEFEFKWSRTSTPLVSTTVVLPNTATTYTVTGIALDCVLGEIRKKCADGLYSNWTDATGCCPV